MAHILIVDDDEAIRSWLRDALEDEGHDVTEAPDGAVALARLAASPEPTVVLLDLMMPRCNGAQFLRAVAADSALASRHRYVVMTAGQMDVPDEVRSLLDGPVLSKPFQLSVLLSAVAAAERRPPDRRPAAEE